jgi:outer membrane protein assembly factor BamD (BamD/ComL family)
LGSEFAVDTAAAVLDSEHQARDFYSQARQNCYQLGREAECLNNIETVVSQFPESRWAGESLVILGDFYHRTNRAEQAREIVRILKKDFRAYTDLQKKAAIIERAVQ